MEVTLGQVIGAMFPDASPVGDYTVQDDGRGAYIARWDLAAPRPTPEQLQAARDRLVARLQADQTGALADRAWLSTPGAGPVTREEFERLKRIVAGLAVLGASPSAPPPGPLRPAGG